MDLTQPVSKQAEYTSLVIQLKSRYILLVVTYQNDTRVRYLDTYYVLLYGSEYLYFYNL